MEDEIINIKKIFVNSFIAISSLSAVLATGLSAYAKNVEQSFNTGNFYSYTATYYGDKSYMSCKTDGTALTASTSDYSGAYKWVRFSILGEGNSKSYYTIDSREETGNSSTVSTDPLPMSDAVVRRIHKAQLHYASNIDSSVVDNYDIRIDKSK